MMSGMSTRTERATFTIPRDELARARERVERGEADSLSALMADALAAANRRAALRDAVAEALEGQPPLSDSELAEARRAVLGTST